MFSKEAGHPTSAPRHPVAKERQALVTTGQARTPWAFAVGASGQPPFPSEPVLKKTVPSPRPVSSAFKHPSRARWEQRPQASKLAKVSRALALSVLVLDAACGRSIINFGTTGGPPGGTTGGTTGSEGCISNAQCPGNPEEICNLICLPGYGRNGAVSRAPVPATTAWP